LLNAIFTTLTDEEISDGDRDKILETLNTSLDGVLRGMGILGSVVSGGKNALLELEKQINKNRPNFDKVTDKLYGIVPFLSAKNNLFNKASDQLKWSESKKYSRNPKPFYDTENPKLNAIAASIEGVTGFPAEELLRKFEAWKYILDQQNESWKRWAVGAGYEPYQLEGDAPSYRPGGGSRGGTTKMKNPKIQQVKIK
jgi:hypothetical protein